MDRWRNQEGAASSARRARASDVPLDSLAALVLEDVRVLLVEVARVRGLLAQVRLLVEDQLLLLRLLRPAGALRALDLLDEVARGRLLVLLEGLRRAGVADALVVDLVLVDEVRVDRHALERLALAHVLDVRVVRERAPVLLVEALALADNPLRVLLLQARHDRVAAELLAQSLPRQDLLLVAQVVDVRPLHREVDAAALFSVG